ncbi:MAG TPA: hypothetical protein VGN64_01865 [Dyadobacter sp.]|nr:hypothetical protein [Dyadobacter sp.]
MKKPLYVAIVIALCFAFTGVKASRVMPQSEKDSIIVTFGNKTRLIIYGDNRSELDKIMKYDLNALLRDLHVKLDSSRSDTTYLREEVDGKRYLKNKSDEDYVRIGVRGVHIKDGDTEVRIDADGVSVKDDDDNDDEKDKDYKRIGKNFNRSRIGSSPRKGFAFALGLNTYGSNDPGGIYNKEDYDLRPFGSRFVSLGYIASAKIASGQKAGFHLDFGIDFSWFNLMYDGNNTISKLTDRVDFPLVMDGTAEADVRKSKLVVPNVNLSLMPTVSFKNSFVSYLSAGVYGGYRLGSYTKVRKVGTKDIDRERVNFYLNDFRYGLAAEIGFRNFVDLFVNYDLNTLHEANRGPKVNMISFGIKL